MRWGTFGLGSVILLVSGAACSGTGGDDSGSGGSSSNGGTGSALGGSGGSTMSGGRGSVDDSGGQPGVGSSSNGGSETSSGGVDQGGTGPGGAGSGGAPARAPSTCESPNWNSADFAEVYDVGPGFELETPSDVPWESIGPGTLVRIHHRDTPYADKWVIAVEATEDEPVVVLGVPEDGVLPQITGIDAVTRSELNYWSDTRGIIKIGGSSEPAVENAKHIFLECLDVSGARETNSFTDDGDATQNYDLNASAIYLENGANITLKNNIFHDNGNGLFIANQSSNVLVSGNQIFDNGNVDSIYEHNSYTEARGVTFEFNHYGPLCEGCPGNNLKDRSSGLVIRYNFIEGGNRTLDLVDSSEEAINGAPDYDDTFVYGNVLVELDGGNRQIVHYGGDGDEAYFRRGTLYFFHNTVVSERASLATLVRLSSNEATIDARNNLFFASPGSTFAVLEDAGTATLAGNWLPTGWLNGSPSLTGNVTASDNQEGDDPGFVDTSSQDFTLESASEARGVAVPLPDAAAGHPVLFQFVGPSGGEARSATEAAGAFE
jgi:parallel beta-helix repeat protein